MYYVYIHKRKTTGEVFYIGKGKGNRAWDTYSRSAHWKNIVRKHGLVVEIYLSNLQEWYALELEMELILKYGKISDGTGRLINHTDGGEGISGYKHTDATKQRQSSRVAGSGNPRADTVKYEFENIHTGIKEFCTRTFLEQKYNISVRDIFKGACNVSHGWKLVANGKATKFDVNKYHLVHESGIEYVGTRFNFKKTHGICLKNMFKRGDKRYNVKGWKFIKIVE